MRCFFLFVLLPLVHAGDWHQWRGPNGDAHAANFAPTSWAQPKQVWRIEVGKGFAAPVVQGDRVYVFSGDWTREELAAYDLTNGTVVWRSENTIAFQSNPYAKKFEGPFSTPLIVGDVIYSVGVTGLVKARKRSDGTLLWQDQFKESYNTDRTLACGNSASPIHADGKVIVMLGGETTGRITAYAADSGKRVWNWDGDVGGYATPVLATIHGKQQLVALTASQVVGLDPTSGKLLWSHPWEAEWRENVPTPVVHNNQVILSGRENNKIQALRPQIDGVGWSVTEGWRNTDYVLYCSSAMVMGNQLVGMSHKNKGQFFGIDADSGKSLWESEGRMGTSGQGIAVGDEAVFVTTDGMLHVFRDGKQVFARSIADGAVWNYPAVVSDGLLIRDSERLTYWRFPTR